MDNFVCKFRQISFSLIYNECFIVHQTEICQRQNKIFTCYLLQHIPLSHSVVKLHQYSSDFSTSFSSGQCWGLKGIVSMYTPNISCFLNKTIRILIKLSRTVHFSIIFSTFTIQAIKCEPNSINVINVQILSIRIDKRYNSVIRLIFLDLWS